jgi:hypothetical protein
MSNVRSTSRSLLTLNGAMVESSWFLISLVDKITVGVGVDWPLAWLLTYRGANCQLWSYVYNKCVEAELCSEAAKMLMSELSRHKCFGYAPK